LQLFQAVSLLDGELADGSPYQACQVGTWPQGLTEIVSQRAHVSSRADPNGELHQGRLPIQDLKFLYLHRPTLQRDLLTFPRQLVGRNSGDLLGRKWRWQLLNISCEFGGSSADLFK